jgi:putative ABC transport system permease protein
VPPGNIPLSEMSRWQRHPMVKRAIPISVGDSFNGYRIVGTTPDFAALYDAEILAGEYWHAPFQAVIGSQVAATTNLTIGSQFDGVHGLTDGGDRHEQSSYQVVGQLVKTGSVLDRLVFTSLESVWQMHGDHRARDHSQEKAIASEHENAHEHQDEHQDQREEAHEHENERRQEHASNASADFSNHEADREITMILIKFSSPLGMLTLPREVNETSSLQAAAPALEIARLVQVVGVGLNWLNAFAAILVLSAALSILAALYASLRARRQGLAVLRCLGATRWELFYLLYIEGMLLTIAGTCLGLVLAHGGMTLLGIVLGAGQGLVLSGWTWASGEFLLVVGMLLVGALTALLPALQAYRTNVAATLTSG